VVGWWWVVVGGWGLGAIVRVQQSVRSLAADQARTHVPPTTPPPPPPTPTNRYQGTADAVRHYLGYLAGEKHAAAEDVLIMAGDQL
jgi:hypothetical protein